MLTIFRSEQCNLPVTLPLIRFAEQLECSLLDSPVVVLGGGGVGLGQQGGPGLLD